MYILCTTNRFYVCVSLRCISRNDLWSFHTVYMLHFVSKCYFFSIISLKKSEILNNLTKKKWDCKKSTSFIFVTLKSHSFLKKSHSFSGNLTLKNTVISPEKHTLIRRFQPFLVRISGDFNFSWWDLRFFCEIRVFLGKKYFSKTAKSHFSKVWIW